MPIDGVISTLPDREYIAALEKLLERIIREQEKQAGDISNLSRAR